MLVRFAGCVLIVFTLACGSPPTSSGDEDAAPTPVPLPDAGPAVDATLLLPDFGIDMGRSRIDLSVVAENFAANACELDMSEQCVDSAGLRRLLRFSVETINLGDGDLVLGNPAGHPGFQWSECHQHSHFRGYADYRLLSTDGSEVVVGRKQAFCLLDSEPYTLEASTTGIYSCLNQGLQAGWADVYPADLPCQFLDITDVPDGDYNLAIEVNPEGRLADSSHANNVGSIALRIGDAELETPTEACPDFAPRYLNRIESECGWNFVGEFDCTPGELSGAGCSQNCGVGSCTGDPMLRVCDAIEPNCTSSVALGRNNDRCFSMCPMTANFLCPSSGRLAVYTASAQAGQAYDCDVATGPGPRTP